MEKQNKQLQKTIEFIRHIIKSAKKELITIGTSALLGLGVSFFFVGPYTMKKAMDAEIAKATNKNWKEYHDATSELLDHAGSASIETLNQLSTEWHNDTKKQIDKDTRAILGDPRFKGRGMGSDGSIDTIIGFLILGVLASGVNLSKDGDQKNKEYLEQLRKIKVKKNTYKYLAKRFEALDDNQQKEVVTFLRENMSTDKSIENIIKNNPLIAEKMGTTIKVNKMPQYPEIKKRLN